jgi:hypothetical protein
MLVMALGRVGAGLMAVLGLVGGIATPGAEAAGRDEVMSLPGEGLPHPLESVVTGRDRSAVSLEAVGGTGSLRVRTSPHPARDSVRCGYGPGRRHSADYRRSGALGPVSTVSFGTPPFYELAVTRPSVRPEYLPKLAPVVARSSIAVPVDDARQLVHASGARLTLHRWQHDFDAGIRLRARLFGSLREGFQYSLDSDVTPDVGFDISSIGCHRPGLAALFDDDATYYPFVVPDGEHVRVNRKRVRDVVRDPYLQGAWAVAVARAGEPARVSYFSDGGRRLYSNTLEFVPERTWRAN